MHAEDDFTMFEKNKKEEKNNTIFIEKTQLEIYIIPGGNWLQST